MAGEPRLENTVPGSRAPLGQDLSCPVCFCPQNRAQSLVLGDHVINHHGKHFPRGTLTPVLFTANTRELVTLSPCTPPPPQIQLLDAGDLILHFFCGPRHIFHRVNPTRSSKFHLVILAETKNKWEGGRKKKNSAYEIHSEDPRSGDPAALACKLRRSQAGSKM